MLTDFEALERGSVGSLLRSAYEYMAMKEDGVRFDDLPAEEAVMMRVIRQEEQHTAQERQKKQNG